MASFPVNQNEATVEVKEPNSRDSLLDKEEEEEFESQRQQRLTEQQRQQQLQQQYYQNTEHSGMGSKYDDEPVCGIQLLKYVLFIFNFFLLLCGAGVLAMGIWTLLSRSDFTQILCTDAYTLATIALIVVGALVIILATTGCYGALQEVRGCLLVYFSLLLVLCVIELGIGIFLYVFRAQMESKLEVCLNETLSYNYGTADHDSFTKTFDIVQKKFRCCGSTGYADWQHSYWKNESNLAGNRSTPDSCCKSVSDNCAVRTHPSNINHRGCVVGLAIYLKDHLIIVALIFLCVAFIEIFGLVFTMCLYCHLLYEEDDGY